MQRRGYPVGDFDQNATDLSVDHPRVVGDRAGSGLAAGGVGTALRLQPG
jgi:hypothetical protein